MLIAFLILIPAKEAWMLFLFAVVFGLTFGGGDALVSILTAELFGLKAHGAILGVIAFLATIGGAIGPLLAGYAFDTASSYQLIFMVFAGISVIGLILVWTLKRTRS
jgi:MFS family permease